MSATAQGDDEDDEDGEDSEDDGPSMKRKGAPLGAGASKAQKHFDSKEGGRGGRGGGGGGGAVAGGGFCVARVVAQLGLQVDTGAGAHMRR